jgi:hypothetical protein
MAQPLLSIDIRHPLVLKSNELVLLTREDGNVPLDIPGFGLFYRDTCYLGGYALALHDTKPLLLIPPAAKAWRRSLLVDFNAAPLVAPRTCERWKPPRRRQRLRSQARP